GSCEDVDKAVAAAKEAYGSWSETSVDDRSKYLQRIAEGLQARMEPLAQLITQEMGMPVRLSQMIQVGLPMTTFMSMSQVLQEVPFEEQIGNSNVLREPIGVVGCITPWNYPLHQIGGKSPNVILEDADLERAVQSGIGECYLNSGQTCSALTRMLVPRSKLDEVERIAKQVAESYTPGDPFGEGTRLGPLVSETQLERVRGYIRKGDEEGAKLVTGGEEMPDGLDKGYFVRPTVFSDVKPDMTVAQEEIFGPVLTIIPYDTEEEAIAIANDTIYGLSGGVGSGDVEHATKV